MSASRLDQCTDTAHIISFSNQISDDSPHIISLRAIDTLIQQRRRVTPADINNPECIKARCLKYRKTWRRRHYYPKNPAG